MFSFMYYKIFKPRCQHKVQIKVYRKGKSLNFNKTKSNDLKVWTKMTWVNEYCMNRNDNNLVNFMWCGQASEYRCVRSYNCYIIKYKKTYSNGKIYSLQIHWKFISVSYTYEKMLDKWTVWRATLNLYSKARIKVWLKKLCVAAILVIIYRCIKMCCWCELQSFPLRFLRFLIWFLFVVRFCFVVVCDDLEYF